MLLSLSGASGVGKSTILVALERTDLDAPVVCVEFDSIGVPEDADTSWRHGAIEHWVRFAVDAQEEGKHVVLCGQVPPGELLAAPSADLLDGIAVCVLTASADTQRSRLLGRGEQEDGLIHHLRFGAWFAAHAADPRHQPEVIRVPSAVAMAWERWEDWEAGDARWPVALIDTDALTPAQVADRVETWARAALAGGAPAVTLR